MSLALEWHPKKTPALLFCKFQIIDTLVNTQPNFNFCASFDATMFAFQMFAYSYVYPQSHECHKKWTQKKTME